jgi:hypothetical protein
MNHTTASGALTIAISSIGGATVKGPMNAFRVKDDVEVLFDVVFTQPRQPQQPQPA